MEKGSSSPEHDDVPSVIRAPLTLATVLNWRGDPCPSCCNSDDGRSTSRVWGNRRIGLSEAKLTATLPPEEEGLPEQVCTKADDKTEPRIDKESVTMFCLRLFSYMDSKVFFFANNCSNWVFCFLQPENILINKLSSDLLVPCHNRNVALVKLSSITNYSNMTRNTKLT